MGVTYQNLLDEINDLRIDNTDDTLDMGTTGLRMINRGINRLQMEHNWEFTIRRQKVSFYKGINIYQLNSDYKAPVYLHNRTKPSVEFELFEYEDFSNINTVNKFSFKNVNGNKYLIVDSIGNSDVIDSLSSTTSDGTWSNVSGTTGLTNNSNNSVNGSGSIQFDMNSSTSGSIRNTTKTPVNISKYDLNGARYMWVYITDSTDLTSITLDIGSSDSNYVSETVTTDFRGEALTSGWNKIKFTSWTQTGTVDFTDITFIQFTINFSSASTTRILINDLNIGEKIDLELEYYSQYFVQGDGDSTPSLKFDGGSNNDEPLYSGQFDWMLAVHIDVCIYDIMRVQEEESSIALAKSERMESLYLAKQRLPERTMHPKSYATPTQYESSNNTQINLEFIYYA